MADPLSISAALLAIVTAALQTSTALHEAITSYKTRDRTISRLHAEVTELKVVLGALAKIPARKDVAAVDLPVLKLLQGPVERCRILCHEFQVAMAKFTSKTKTNIVDWAKMRFMKGDMNEFVDTVTSYKSTISIGLGIVTMHHASVKHEVLVQYMEITQKTMYDLQLQLQRMEQRVGEHDTSSSRSSSAQHTDLSDELLVTRQCLKLCRDGQTYIEQLILDAAPVLNPNACNALEQFEAQKWTRDTLAEARQQLVETVSRLAYRLSGVTTDLSSTSQGREQLQSDIETARQCLQVCQMAETTSTQKVFTVEEAIADQGSDQVVVSSIADLFNVGKALSTNNSAQLIGSLTPDNLDRMIESRYSSRFGVVPPHDNVRTTTSAMQDVSAGPSRSARERLGTPNKQDKALPNEVRKRTE